MARITEIKLVPKEPVVDTLKTEGKDGLDYAVVYKPTNQITALFSGSYWAHHFVGSTNIGSDFEIREVAND